MTGTPARSTNRRWTDHDTALWHACDVDQKLRTGRRSDLPLVAVPFALSLGDQREQIVASGRFEMATWEAVGDGSYMHKSGFFLGAGGPALALGAAFLGANAIGNAARKNKARRDQEPRWVWGTKGDLHVGTHGFYLLTPAALLTWGWHAIDSAQIAAPATLWIQGRSTTGPTSLMIRSIWAELAFLLWSRARNPRHPQLIDRSWLPAGWAAWARTHGEIPGVGAH